MTDVHSCSYYCDRPECIKAQRDELRERLAQPEQEPNYWLGYVLQAHTEKPFEGATPLYTAQPQGIYYTPPQRKPLTDEEIARACVPLGWAILSFTEVARAIEAAHGIKEKNA